MLQICWRKQMCLYRRWLLSFMESWVLTKASYNLAFSFFLQYSVAWTSILFYLSEEKFQAQFLTYIWIFDAYFRKAIDAYYTEIHQNWISVFRISWRGSGTHQSIHYQFWKIWRGIYPPKSYTGAACFLGRAGNWQKIVSFFMWVAIGVGCRRSGHLLLCTIELVDAVPILTATGPV